MVPTVANRPSDTYGLDPGAGDSAGAGRTQPIPITGARGGAAPAGRHRSTSNVSVSSVTSDDTLPSSHGSARRSSVPNWLRSVGHKLSGNNSNSNSNSNGADTAGARGPMSPPVRRDSNVSEAELATSPRDREPGLVGRLKRFSLSNGSGGGEESAGSAVGSYPGPGGAMPPPSDAQLARRKSSAASGAGSAAAAAAATQQYQDRRRSVAGSAPTGPGAGFGPAAPLSAGTTASSGAARGAPVRGRLSANKLQELGKLLPKRVMFAEDLYAHDPPQQIPPMHPRKGNVDFRPSGELALSLADRPRDFDFPPYLERNHGELSRSAGVRAHEQASRLHSSLNRSLGIFSKFSGDAGDANDDVEAAELGEGPPAGGRIDVDANAHADHDAADAENESVGTDSSESDGAAPTPEQIYVRCCHLREILPIKSTLKQLKDQVAPLTTLYVANSKPTMIEILAMTDFLAIVPVAFLQLDNTVLTTPMLQLFISALRLSTHLTNITFENTQIDEVGWKLLCLFVANNTSLLGLNLSCDPTRGRLPPFDRRNADWALFARALTARGQFGHLSLSGVKLSSQQLQMVLASFKNGLALELSNNDLGPADIQAVIEWMEAEDTQVEALNLGGNDLSGIYDAFPRLVHLKRLAKLGIANTNVQPPRDAGEFFTPAAAKTSNIVAVDFAGTPVFVQGILDTLVEVLPYFPRLVRLELARCGLSNDQIVKLCEAVVDCPQLAHLGVQNNEKLNETAQAALCVAVSMSESLVTVDVDTSYWSDTFKKQLPKYALANLEKISRRKTADAAAAQQRGGPQNTIISHTAPPDVGAPDEGSSEIRDFRQDLSRLVSEVDELRPAENNCSGAAEKMVQLRRRSRALLQDLLRKKAAGPLSVPEREDLIRLYFYDTTLDRVSRQFCENSQAGVRPQGEEAVSALDEQAQAPPVLSRRSSTNSLRQLEHEEAATHKANTYLMGFLHDRDLATKIPHALDVIHGTGETPEAVLRRVQRLGYSDLEQLIS